MTRALDNCRRCGADITALRLRRDRQWCSKECRTYFMREQRRIEARHRRPLCLICSKPMHYGASGTNLKARTCGARVCTMRLNNWFTREARASAGARPR